MSPKEVEAEIASIAAMKARGFWCWEILCSTQTDKTHALHEDHLLDQLGDSIGRMAYAPSPSETEGVWAPVLAKDGKPMRCPTCNAPLARRPVAGVAP